MTLEIGVVGLAEWVPRLPTNLVSAERQVTAYVRRPDRIASSPRWASGPPEAGNLAIATSSSACCRTTILVASRVRRRWTCIPASARRHPSFHEHDSVPPRQNSLQETRASRSGLCVSASLRQSGGCQGATLFVIAAGRSADLNRCQPPFQLSWPAGLLSWRRPAHANLIKLLGNMMTATTLEMLAETAAVLLKRAWTRSISSTS